MRLVANLTRVDRLRPLALSLLVAGLACAPRSNETWVVLDRAKDASVSVDTSRISQDSSGVRLWLGVETLTGDEYTIDSTRKLRVFRSELSIQLDCAHGRIRHLVDRLYDSVRVLMAEQPSDQQWASFGTAGMETSGPIMCRRLREWGFAR